MRIQLLAVAAIVCVAFAGCTTPTETKTTSSPPVVHVTPPSFVEVEVVNLMSFNQSLITPAQGLSSDLYEPLIEVSPTGTIYVAAHVAGAVSTASPAYVSTDDGASWKQLPFAGPAALPPPGQGSGVPSGDEGMIVADEKGNAYMADVALHSYPVEGWCNEGATQCYHNPNAYDRAAATTESCSPLNLNDRPFAAYANGTLLISNNPGSGAVQIAVMQVPFALPTGGPATWNMCASGSATGGIPGVPAMRDDLRFAVPQFNGQRMLVVRGDAHDIAKTEWTEAFKMKNNHGAAFGGGANFGSSAFDKAGNLYVTGINNTAKHGRFIVGMSTDAGANFTTLTVQTTGFIGFNYVDGNLRGPGAVVSWIQDGDTAGKADVYAAHILPVDGHAVISDVSLVADEVDAPCGDVMGAAAGPDGRAYVVVHSSPMGCTGTPLGTPLSVYVQGPGTAVLPEMT